uniref:Uncharacterized protein n=1 Tax=Globisporangium ultimum (strain ATCC 200006 / CBS 805.95 / DAOM BR144) TaxID=431595 RepID=K3W584_GLOUD
MRVMQSSAIERHDALRSCICLYTGKFLMKA